MYGTEKLNAVHVDTHCSHACPSSRVEILYALRSGLATRERNSVPILCSMGIVRMKTTAPPLEELPLQADMAVYSVEQNGKGSCRIITI